MSYRKILARLALTTTFAVGAVACGDDEPPPQADSGLPRADSGVIIDAGKDDAGVIDLDLTVEPATLTLQEGGAAATFAVALTSAPSAELTITLSSGDTGAVTVSPASFTFNAENFSTPQTVSATPVDDADTRDESVTVTLAATGLGETTATVVVEDDDAQALVVTSSSVTMAEGGSATFTVGLAHEPDADTEVSLSSANTGVATVAPATLSFSVANYATPQIVTVTGLDDSNVVNDSTTVTVASTGLTSVDVAVVVTDVDQQGILGSPTALNLGEGTSGEVSVSLAAQPVDPVTLTVTSADPSVASVSTSNLTFTAANWNQAQTVTVDASQDPDTQNESTSLTLSGDGMSDVSIAVSVTDDDTQAIVLSRTAITIGEGDTATISVSLLSQPAADVIVTLTSGNANIATAAPASFTFTPGDWANPRTAIITAPEDTNLAPDTTTLTASADGLTSVAAVITVLDDDAQALVVNPSTLSVNEGASQDISVRLAYQPAGPVTVNAVSSDAAAAAVAPASLTFDATNWDVNQSFAVSGAQDVDVSDESATVTVSSTGLPNLIIPVTVVDDDVQNFSVNPTALDLTEGGNAGTFQVALTQQPGADVTVTLASSDGGAASVNITNITFTPVNYDQPVTVTVTPQDDADAVDETVTITLTAAGLTARQVTVTVDDDDTQAHIVTPLALSVDEQGAPATFTVRLAFQPVTNTQVTITSADPTTVSATPNVLTFTPANYATAQTVTVRGLSDVDLVDELVNLAVASAIAPTVNVAVTVVEDDLQALLVSTNTVNVTENIGPGSFTVQLAYQPVNTIGVTVTVDDTTAGTANPTFILFTTTNWSTPVTVNVAGTPDQDQVSESTFATVASPGLASEVVTINVTDDDFQSIILSRNTIGMDEGTVETFTARLAFIPLAPNETVTLSSSDVDAANVAPTSLVFDAATYATPQALTVTAPADNDVLDETVTITLDSDAAATPNATVTVNVDDDDIQQIVRSPAAVTIGEGGVRAGATADVSVRLLWDPSGATPITLASQDPGAFRPVPPTLVFDSGNYAVDQISVITAQDDDDVQDESGRVVALTGAGAARVNVAVTVLDDDTQAILTDVAEGLTVNEEGTVTFDVWLAFRPNNNRVITVSTGDPAIATVNRTTLTFTPVNYRQPQTVTITGTTDANLDDASTLITLSTPVGLAPPEGAANVTLGVDVRDNDVQRILFETIPANLAASLQEGGPTLDFRVWLEFPPRGGAGAEDNVLVVSEDAARVGLSPATLTFDDLSFDVPQVVTITAFEDDDDLHERLNAVLSISEDAVTTAVPIRVLDDEQPVVVSATYGGLSGATEFTRRANVRWGSSLLAVSASDDTTGRTVLVSDTRELDSASVAGVFADPTGVSTPIEVAEFDGTNFGFFLSDASGIVFARVAEDLQQTISQVVIPQASADQIDFWPTWTGTQYGLIYRNAANGNLRFRTVSLAGVAGTERQVTTADGSADFHPNLHWNGAGYTALYTSAGEVRCVRLNASGFLLGGSDVALAGFPGGGAFVSSVWDGASIVAVYIDPTLGLRMVRINSANCTLVGGHATVRGADTYLTSPPVVDYNGVELAVAYDITNEGTDSSGVLVVSDDFSSVDGWTLGAGRRPSITWAGDRWVARRAGSVELVAGSFETDHCQSGVADADEIGVDCGGSECPPCGG
ncbi:MAG: hypothetical protein IT384_14830 [Deltaproteobacteria bacterium]|nr:hypothetical protein [Deltaproteobacteria bacterium]